jgi:hypothetical protein
LQRHGGAWSVKGSRRLLMLWAVWDEA